MMTTRLRLCDWLVSKARGRRPLDPRQGARPLGTRDFLRRQDGFTLVELMVVVVIIGILATIGLPFFNEYILEGNLKSAEPHLRSIAAKQRIYYNRTGKYLATASEQDIQSKLGVDLSDARDFCFMIFCTSASCVGSDGSTATTIGTLIATTDSTTVTQDFQVIAVLRAKNTDGTGDLTVTGAGVVCTAGTTPVKKAPAGWVRASGKGGEGRVLILSYPTPADGQQSATISSHTVTHSWNQGITISDAQKD